MLNKKNKNKKAETFTNMRAISQKFCNQYNTSNIFLILLGGGGRGHAHPVERNADNKVK